MLPFCGYNMGDYLGHWLSVTEGRDLSKLPRIFHVNWFRKDADGSFLWPGFGENVRVLEWIFRRCEDTAEAVRTPIGLLPAALDLDGLEFDPATLEALLAVSPEDWRAELDSLHEHFATFGDQLPPALAAQLDALAARLQSA
jgi:phosphoenolpyruvate carboxykinase (GTP)